MVEASPERDTVVSFVLRPHNPMKWLMSGNMVGKHADTIPADISMAVQPTVGARVYDGSLAS